MRALPVSIGMALLGAGIGFAIEQNILGAATCLGVASLVATHRGRRDAEVSARVRGATGIVTNVVLASGLALEVIFILAWLLAPQTVDPLRADWIVYVAFAIAGLQTLVWHRDPKFAAEPGLRLSLTDLVLTAASITAWAGAVIVSQIAPIQAAGRELVPLDAQHLILAGVILQIPVLMLRRGIPSLLSYLENELPLSLERRGFARDAPIYYPLAATGAALAITTLTWMWLRPSLPSPLDNPIAGLIMATSLTVLAFILSAGYMSRAQTRSSLVAKRYDVDERRLLLITSTSLTFVAIFACAAAWLFLVGRLVVGGFLLTEREIRDLIVLAILAGTGPIGFYMHARARFLDRLEDRLPDLLSDMAESTRSGLTLSSAVMQARNNDYGVLSHDVEIMARQLSWGFSFQEVWRRFGERRKSAPVRRIVRLVIEAAHSGGNTSQVLAAAGKSSYELRALEADRRSTMATQMIVIYVIFGVFLLVIAVLSAQFVPPLVEATQKVSGGALPLFGGGPTIGQLRGAYVDAILVQAVGSGIVAGVLHESRWTAGLRHVFLMTLIAYVVARAWIL